MLGENHSLIHEFPEYKDVIAMLSKSNEAFAKQAKKYNLLDAEIRKLELNGAPIDDEAMHQLKHDRAVLKDALYQCLVTEKQ
ncbi:YdcH family protein [Shewanella sp. D64]|uniref:YdcH family protein n=1 Tax=unclassified Shewanella TaxID=196818 RepID=UPI0022BA2605|nr:MULTISPECIES: YdcH family protein [unclassified Shewanella]MEC4725102.1 YdcH family protein [Shewanella sp. D64]MEC4737003.1 YdcH family protein [Shewanella sp. E94]WBJ96591.1 YdcH family protein [Shewanella sp. MTB7]